MSQKPSPEKREEKGGQAAHLMTLRVWNGINFPSIARALRRHRFAVSPSRIPMATFMTALGLVNSALASTQRLFWSRKVAETPLVDDPVFIIGHWRSGTTLLHEYIIRDQQFTYPDSYACFAPTHFLLTRKILRPTLSFLLPKKRPMDNMAVGFDRPQEDEFALCNMGVPSPYLHIMFPNLPPADSEYLTLRSLSDDQRRQWLDALDRFLRCLTVISPRRVVVKSPPHTCRIRTLLERYPRAKFLHLHRDPYVLFPSTRNLWMQMSRDHGFQVPTGEGLEEYIFETFETMYGAFESDRALLAEDQIVDVAYEDLVRSPMEVLGDAYRRLGLSGFERAKERFATFAESQRDYRKNRYAVSPQIREAIARRWRGYFERYGYALASSEE